jgi:hypothetical protein
MVVANGLLGHLHRPRGRIHRRRRQDHLLDCQDCVPPVIAFSLRRLASTRIIRRILMRCRTGAGEEKPKENVIKLGQPKFKMSGPLADMVQERLRRRNEL